LSARSACSTLLSRTMICINSRHNPFKMTWRTKVPAVSTTKRRCRSVPSIIAGGRQRLTSAARGP